MISRLKIINELKIYLENSQKIKEKKEIKEIKEKVKLNLIKNKYY